MGFLGFADGAPIVVTGAGSGIGRATALGAAADGLHVAAWDLVADTAAATAKAITDSGGRAISVGVDATDEAAVKEAWRRTVDELGSVSLLANIAGPPNWADLEFVDGVAACLRCARVPTEAWLELVPGDQRSTIFIASVAGTRYGMQGWYGVGKMGIVGYMRSLAAFRPGGIRANAIAPDLTDTPRVGGLVESMGDVASRVNPMGRIAQPLDVANAALFLLSPAASYINGVTLDVDGGVNLISRDRKSTRLNSSH